MICAACIQTVFLPTIPQIKFQMIVGAKKGYNIRPWGPGRPVLNIEEAAAYGRVYIERNYIHVNKHLTPFTRNSTNFTCLICMLYNFCSNSDFLGLTAYSRSLLVRFRVVWIWIVWVFKNTPNLHSANYEFLAFSYHLYYNTILV